MSKYSGQKLNIKGFELSINYKLLWALISLGYRIPCWIVYDIDEISNLVRWDIAEVKKSESVYYSIGSRGIGYESYENTLEAFCKNCADFSIHFIEPTNNEQS